MHTLHGPHATLAKIVAKASFPEERLRHPFHVDKSPSSQASARKRLQSWQKKLGGTDDNLAARLFLESLSPQEALSSLHEVSFDRHGTLPHWAITLDLILRNTVRVGVHHENASGLPFEEVMLPLARSGLDALVASSNDVPSTETHVSRKLMDELLDQLISLCSPSLLVELNLMKELGQLDGRSSRQRYLSFVERFNTPGGYWEFFETYSVLARLVGLTICHWIDRNSELFKRFRADRPAIQQLFGGHTQLGAIADLKTSLSDPHSNHRTVSCVTFESGVTVVYKPKDIRLDCAYNDLLRLINKANPPLRLRTLQILNRGEYAWVEYVKESRCSNEGQLRRFYRRSGAHLCLAYLFDTVDLIDENVIASGEDPVLIDVEAMFHPTVRRTGSDEICDSADQLAQDRVAHSVLKTGLLPAWIRVAKGRPLVNFGGIGGKHGLGQPLLSKQWTDIGLDSISITRTPATLRPASNNPSPTGTLIDNHNIAAEVERGFCEMYMFLLRNRGALLDTSTLHRQLRDCKSRFIHRSTSLYYRLRDRCTNPMFVQNGADFTVELEVMARAFLSESSRKEFSVVRAELKAMRNLDIPFFSSAISSADLIIAPAVTVSDFFEQAPLDRVLTRITEMSPQLLEEQVNNLQGGFAPLMGPSPRKIEDREVLIDAELKKEVVVRRAKQLGNWIEENAIRGNDGSVTWIGLQACPNTEHFMFEPLDASLYCGRPGVAIFLAALGVITREERFINTALSSMQTIRGEIHQNSPKLLRLGVGGLTGLGGLVYSLATLARLLDDNALMSDAEACASQISEGLIGSDDQFDIAGGSAGAIQGLLALYEATGSKSVLDIAVACGEHLIESRTEMSQGRTWFVFEKPLTGLSHGAAGIAYSLLRLHSSSKKSAFKQAAKEAISYERSTFSSLHSNWPDLRGDGVTEFMTSWCHGAVGIGLARSKCAELDSDAFYTSEVEAAVEATLRFGVSELDHLCCGNMGRVEFLSAAAKVLKRSELARISSTWVAKVAQSSDTRGYYGLNVGATASATVPGFFQGLSGIGYSLLRQVEPDRLPQVLTFS
jgi:type 2 lantibiotic biosynthesis protein LanM